MRETDLKQIPKQKFIEVVYSPTTQGYLREYCLDNGFDLTVNYDGSQIDADDFVFHSTVWYTESKHIIKNGEKEVYVEAFPKKFSLFGEDKNVLVLEVTSDDLINMHIYYGEKYDMVGTYDDYKPHITLSYNYSGEDLDNLELPNIDLIADKLMIKDVDENL